MSFIEVLKVLVFGIVEGFTEWLPISSTGHMILLDELIHLNVSKDFKDVFLVVIQLGAILAVVLLYFYKLNPFIRLRGKEPKGAVIPLMENGGNGIGVKIHTMILWMKVIVACIPAAVLGILIDDWMEAHLTNAYVVSATLILYGILFIVVGIATFGASCLYYHRKKDKITYAALPLVVTAAVAVAGMVEWIFHLSNPCGLLLMLVVTPLVFEIEG